MNKVVTKYLFRMMPKEKFMLKVLHLTLLKMKRRLLTIFLKDKQTEQLVSISSIKNLAEVIASIQFILRAKASMNQLRK
jgi:hypothetical protein